MSAYTFVAKVQKLRRIAIPKPTADAADIHEGDLVRVTVSKEVKYRDAS